MVYLEEWSALRGGLLIEMVYLRCAVYLEVWSDIYLEGRFTQTGGLLKGMIFLKGQSIQIVVFLEGWSTLRHGLIRWAVYLVGWFLKGMVFFKWYKWSSGLLTGVVYVDRQFSEGRRVVNLLLWLAIRIRYYILLVHCDYYFQLAVTLRKESESQSSTFYDALDPYEPTINFQNYIDDNESIVDKVGGTYKNYLLTDLMVLQDLVFYICILQNSTIGLSSESEFRLFDIGHFQINV